MLRGLLRAIDRHLTAVAGNPQWRAHVLAEFRRGAAAEGGAGGAAGGLQLAREYTRLIDNIAHHRVRHRTLQCISARRHYSSSSSFYPNTAPASHALQHTHPPRPCRQGLLTGYNLGLDPDERNKRMVEATARRVGFAMPSEEKPPPRARKGGGSSGSSGGGAAAAGQGGGSNPGQQGG